MSAIIHTNSKSQLTEDISPPWGVALSAKYKRSFAFITIKDRLPVILTKVIDGLSRDKDSITVDYGEEGREDVKKVISGLSQLKNEMITDKNFKELSVGDDASIWNDYLSSKTENGNSVSWFQTEWLYAECYMYRRIKEAFLKSETLKEYDPFKKQKDDCLEESLTSMDVLGSYLTRVTETRDVGWEANDYAFQRMLKHSLWANKVDLSLSVGNRVDIQSNPLKVVDELDKLILADDSKEMWIQLSESLKVKDLVIDIVLDNAGLEVMTDMCLADHLMSMCNSSQIRFHCKAIPWFVSDVMEKDFYKAIERLSEHTKACQNLASKWKNYLQQGMWTIHSETFWTLPFSYNEMKERDSTLYNMLAESSMIIFKGDLNYRKLLGDINWNYKTPFHTALRGFNPAPIVAIRTAKADLIAGLDAQIYEPVMAQCEDWLITGEYGLIQFDGASTTVGLTKKGT